MPTSSPTHLYINSQVSIPLSELRFRFVRSRGPGGQHVNTSATQVELTLDVARSPSLAEAHKQRILSALANLIDSSGILHLQSQSTRSQLRNRQDVTARLQALLRGVLKPPNKRRPTRPTGASRQRRLEGKKRRGAVKRARRAPYDDSTH
ncbi:MAG TPA: alternative ribosome rescue aminoacyl-tRNA hydrolase ArfB [Anaerolineae bacterium]|nr:alternative ribosome rescue aminoacyl-tRNA hydrolase ArfB [Anaerolineae bacterium]